MNEFTLTNVGFIPINWLNINILYSTEWIKSLYDALWTHNKNNKKRYVINHAIFHVAFLIMTNHSVWVKTNKLNAHFYSYQKTYSNGWLTVSSRIHGYKNPRRYDSIRCSCWCTVRFRQIWRWSTKKKNEYRKKNQIRSNSIIPRKTHHFHNKGITCLLRCSSFRGS